MSKYRVVFVEESADHLAEMSSAMLALEKNLEDPESIDLIFRMAHSIKGMAASLEYDSITEVAHALEDRMHKARDAGHAGNADELSLLFRGFDCLESMVAVVRDTDGTPPREPELVAMLSADREQAASAEVPVGSAASSKKKDSGEDVLITTA
jgi:two-component system chemotaxis sensor kinase CheA